jgi:hypothetical protein
LEYGDLKKRRRKVKEKNSEMLMDRSKWIEVNG